MRKSIIIGATCCACLFGGSARAAIVFSEDFSDEATATGSVLNFTGFDQFDVSDGTVDLIDSGGFGITCETTGCVDLDGSTRDAGRLSAQFQFLAGVAYTVSARLGGNQRGGAEDSVSFGVEGLAASDLTFAAGDPFATFDLAFTPAATVTAALFFQDQGADNIGVILDRVSIDADGASPVPLPASALLLLGALGGLAGTARRRATPPAG